MFKNLLLIFLICCLSIPYPTLSYASDFKLIIHEFICEGDVVVIHFGVINYINFDRPDVSIVFKVLKDKKPIGCREIITTIPKRADGSEVEEVILELRCEEGAVELESEIFHEETNYSKQDRIDQFFTGCPR